jgi:hypothetical protein
MTPVLKLIPVVILILCISCMPRNDDLTAWNNLIKEHLVLYPQMQPDDVYKLVYQGIMGPGHLGNDTTQIAFYLKDELNSIESSEDEGLFENITPDSSYIRINLKRFKYENRDPALLVKIIAQSADIPKQSRSRLVKVWSNICREVENVTIPLNKTAFRQFDQFIKKNDYPVIHHSPEYMQEYQPAYRVVSRAIWHNNVNHK